MIVHWIGISRQRHGHMGIAMISFLSPVISINACYMLGRYYSWLLMACVYDAENQSIPFAFRILEKKVQKAGVFFYEMVAIRFH